MYLEKIIFDNRAPFEHLEIDFKNSGVNVITAIMVKVKQPYYHILQMLFMNLPDQLIHKNLRERKINYIVFLHHCII